MQKTKHRSPPHGSRPCFAGSTSRCLRPIWMATAVVINADKIKLTGNKEAAKEYYRYSGYAGGLKVSTAAQLRDEDPERIITQAVKGMLP